MTSGTGVCSLVPVLAVARCYQNRHVELAEEDRVVKAGNRIGRGWDSWGDSFADSV